MLLHYLPCVRMDKKGGDNDVIYPDIMFCVDGFEEVYICIYSTLRGRIKGTASAAFVIQNRF